MRIERICETCGKKFTVTPSSKSLEVLSIVVKSVTLKVKKETKIAMYKKMVIVN